MNSDDTPNDWTELKKKMDRQMEKLRFNSVLPLYVNPVQQAFDPSTSQGIEPIPCEKCELKIQRTVWDVKADKPLTLVLTENANRCLEEVIQKLRLELSRLDAIQRHKVRKTAFRVVPTKKSNLSGALRTGKPGLHKQKLLAKKRSFSKKGSIFSESNLNVLDWPEL